MKRRAESALFYETPPESDAELARRIGDADCVLVSHTTRIGAEALRAAPKLRYVGMCCSLYAPESANVDIRAAESLGIAVAGVRDYGDPGVPEYVVSELVRLLHGFGEHRWRDEPYEFTDLNVGVLGMGTTGALVAAALKHFHARVHYYSRTRKEALERAEGYRYLPLDELLGTADILVSCLNRNAILLDEREFRLWGDGKILVNISIGPGHDVGALGRWLDRPGNFMFGDTVAAVDPSGALLAHPRVICARQSAAASTLTYERLGEKVVKNIDAFLAGNRSGG